MNEHENAQPLRCANTKRVLAWMDATTLFLWCRTCHTEHPVTKDTLIKAFEEMAISKTYSVHESA
jgi:hypothetical protein